MIKVNDLVPGKVITSRESVWTGADRVDIITAWMIIGFQDHVKRRHSRTKAPREGWHVLLLKFGDGDRVLHDVTITPTSMSQWKRLF